MTDRIERELWLPAPPDEVWEAVTRRRLARGRGRARPAAGRRRQRSAPRDARSRPAGSRRSAAPARLAFWWAVDGEPATRVELTLEAERRDDTAAGRRDAAARAARPRRECRLPGSAGRPSGRRWWRPEAWPRRRSRRRGVRRAVRSHAPPLLAAIAEHPEATATELAAELPISRQAVLKHLTALGDAGLLDRERSGREVRYRVTPAPLSDAVSWMADGRRAVG